MLLMVSVCYFPPKLQQCTLHCRMYVDNNTDEYVIRVNWFCSFSEGRWKMFLLLLKLPWIYFYCESSPCASSTVKCNQTVTIFLVNHKKTDFNKNVLTSQQILNWNFTMCWGTISITLYRSNFTFTSTEISVFTEYIQQAGTRILFFLINFWQIFDGIWSPNHSFR